MRVVCLGWGSLIWDPRVLKLRERSRPWYRDGPALPLEFARQSVDGRLTVVALDAGSDCRTLWADMTCESMANARENLREREGTTLPNIGVWGRGMQAQDDLGERIAQWARERNIDGVVWTKLGPKFNARSRTPTKQEVVDYLSSLTGEASLRAKQYVERVPEQIATPYRATIEAKLSWTYDRLIAEANIELITSISGAEDS